MRSRQTWVSKMTMSRKDYVKFAEMLKWAWQECNLKEEFELLEYLADELCLIFTRDNPSFNPQRFIEACQFTEGDKDD